MDNKKEFNNILKTIKKLEHDLKDFNCNVKKLKIKERKKIVKYCNLCKQFHYDKYINYNNAPTNNKKFKKLFCVC